MGLGSSGTVMFRGLHIEVGSEGRLSSRENMGRRGGQKECLRAAMSKAPWMVTGQLMGRPVPGRVWMGAGCPGRCPSPPQW